MVVWGPDLLEADEAVDDLGPPDDFPADFFNPSRALRSERSVLLSLDKEILLNLVLLRPRRPKTYYYELAKRLCGC